MTTSSSEHNPAADLEINSLYIATSQRMADQGTFHWAVVLTDDSGKAKRIHWTVIKTRDPKSPAEGLVCIPDYSPSTYSRGNTATFAFFKVDGYDARAGADWDTVWNCAVTVYPEHLRNGFPIVKQNRRMGIGCRTWALGFLRRLIEVEILHRSVEEISGLEKLIIERSIAIESDTEEFTGSELYTV